MFLVEGGSISPYRAHSGLKKKGVFAVRSNEGLPLNQGRDLLTLQPNYEFCKTEMKLFPLLRREGGESFVAGMVD